MKSAWKITTNIIGEKRMYGVYRTIDVDEIDHSGNREFYDGPYLYDRALAEKIVGLLNDYENCREHEY